MLENVPANLAPSWQITLRIREFWSESSLNALRLTKDPFSLGSQRGFTERICCYIPSPRAIGPLVPEKKTFKVFFLPYMCVAAILWPRCGEQTLFPLTIEAPYEIWLWFALWFLRRRQLKSFPYMSLCKTRDPWDGAIFYPRAMIWTIF